MSSNEFVPTVAGIVMLVFGLALGLALIKGVIRAAPRRRWPITKGTVRIENSAMGKRNAVALITYSAEGQTHTIEVPTGGLSSDGLRGEKIDVSVNPTNPTDAVPTSTIRNTMSMLFFAFISLCFALFGLFALIRVFTN